MNFHEFYIKIKELSLTFMVYRSSQLHNGVPYLAPVTIRIINDPNVTLATPPVSLLIIAQTKDMIDVNSIDYSVTGFEGIGEMVDLPKNWNYTYLLTSKDYPYYKPVYLFDDYTDIYNAIAERLKV